MSIKISELPSATSVGDNDLVPIVQGGETKKASASAFGGGGGGTTDYTDLSNKPSINNVTLSGNKSLSDLGITDTTYSAGTNISISANNEISATDTTYTNATTTTSGLMSSADKTKLDNQFKELTSPVRIWDLDDGTYKLPTGCVVYYYGATATNFYYTLTSSALIIINSSNSSYKYFTCYFGENMYLKLLAGYSTSTKGRYYEKDIGSLLVAISSFVKNDLNYTTSTTQYALSAYQGYLLNQNKQDKLTAGTNITIDENNVISATGGGGGTSDYTDLSNKPSINSVTLTGNKTSGDLNLVGTGDIATTIDSTSTNSQVAGAKAVYDATLDNYSTTEQMIGAWIDGKPLYRKIVTSAFPQVTSDGTQVYTSIDLSSLSPEEVIIEWANTFNAAKTATQMFPIARNIGTTSNSELIARVLYSSNYLYIYCKIQSYNTNTLIASILYTKTTDTATQTLNLTRGTSTGSLVGMGDRAELTSLEVADTNVGEIPSEDKAEVTVEEKTVEVEPIETLKEEKESGDTI